MAGGTETGGAGVAMVEVGGIMEGMAPFGGIGGIIPCASNVGSRLLGEAEKAGAGGGTMGGIPGMGIPGGMPGGMGGMPGMGGIIPGMGGIIPGIGGMKPGGGIIPGIIL